METSALISPGTWLALAIGAPIVLAATYPAFPRMRAPFAPALLLALLEGCTFVALYTSGQHVSFSLPWLPAHGITFSFRLDELAFLFTLLITGIGALILVFSIPYIPHDFKNHKTLRRPGTYYALVLLFMGSMLGLVCADDLLTLYLFWEATTVSSFLLIGIHIHRQEARDSALQSMVLTAGAGVLLFAAFLVLIQLSGGASLSLVLSKAPEIAMSSLAPAIAIGILIGTTAKSAQAPFHPWLPAAMVAPTPVSAYLHSATMVAAGVFLLARLGPLVTTLPILPAALVVVGVLTMLMGGLIATRRSRLKEILAYSTISQYGYMTLLLGLGAFAAATFMMASHAILKAGLFLTAGSITHSTGEDDLDRLGGLWRSHPVSAFTTFVLALGVAGLPATSGFWMKEFLYREVIEESQPWLVTASLAAGTLTLVYMLRYAGRIFLGSGQLEIPPIWERAPPHRGPGHGRRWITLTLQTLRSWRSYKGLGPLLLPGFFLAAIALLAGLFPSLGVALSDPAAASAAGHPVATSTTLHWPPDRALWLGIATYLLGILAAFWLLVRDERIHNVPLGPLPPSVLPAYAPATLLAVLVKTLGANALYHHCVSATESSGRLLCRFQTGRLLDYLLFLISIPVLLGLFLLPGVESWPGFWPLDFPQRATLSFAALALSAIGLAIASAVVRSHTAAILLVGGVGFLLSLIYALLRAPDVALVQVAVETVSALLLFVALGRLPFPLKEEIFAGPERRKAGAHIAAVVFSGALGATLSAVVLAISAASGDASLARSYFPLTASVGAESVVSTILTDFRSVDTLGEISVFAAAAIGTVLVLGRRSQGRRRDG